MGAVSQPGTHTQFVIEYRSEPSSKNRIHQLNRHTISIRPRDSDIAHDVKALRGVRLVNEQKLPAFYSYRCRQLNAARIPARAPCPLRKSLRKHPLHFRCRKISDRSNADVLRHVMRPIKLDDLITFNSRRGPFVPFNRPAISMIPEDKCMKLI